MTRPSSYTQDPHHEAKFDYNILKKQVRNTLQDRFKEFDKLSSTNVIMDRTPTQKTSPDRSDSNSNSKLKYSGFYSSYKQAQQTSASKRDNIFSSIQTKKTESQKSSSPVRLSGLQKSLSQIGPIKNQSLQNIYKQESSFNIKPSYLGTGSTSKLLQPTVPYAREQRTQGSLSSLSSFNVTSAETPSRRPILSQIIPIQKLVEVQNLLDLTPPGDLAQFPRYYLEELLKVGQAITHTLKFHHDQQRNKA